jgi:hypothetical protein
MNTIIHEQAGKKAAEVRSDSDGAILITTPQDALELLMSVSYEHGVQKVVLHQKDLIAAFFDLKTRLAGEVLQKVANYRMQLAIVGDFGNIPSDSLRSFILESNRGKQVFFADTVEAALQKLFSEDL